MKGDVIESNSPSADLSDNILDAESLERLKKKKKGEKKLEKWHMISKYGLHAPKYKLNNLFYCCSDFLPLLLKQLVLFSARHKSINKMIHECYNSN